MNKTIPLIENRSCDFSIKFFISAKTCVNSKITSGDVSEIGKKVSASPSLYINRYKFTDKYGKTDFRYDVFTVCGVFTCVKNAEHGNFAVVSVSDDDFYKKRQAINQGLCFTFNKKIQLTIQHGNEFYHYENGSAVSRLGYITQGGFEYIDNQFNASKPEELSQGEISEDFLNLLKCAESYSETDYALEEQAALIDGKLFYKNVLSTDVAIGDSKVYRFECMLSDEQTSKNAKRNLIKKWAAKKVVEIELNDLEKVNVPIYKAELSIDNPYLDLIFINQINFSEIPLYGYIQIPLNSTVKNTQLKAINQIREQNVPAAFLENALSEGKCQPFEVKVSNSLLEGFKNRKYPLNKSQCDAVTKAISAEDIYLVMGPPGTGKTTVITEWVKYFVSEKKLKILIASQNNSAVDNVLKKLKNEPSVEMLRISGNEQKVDTDVSDYFYKNKVDKARETISQKVTENQKMLLALKEKWSKIEPDFNLLEQNYKQYNEVKAQIDNNLSTASKHYISARSVFLKIQSIKRQFDQKYSSLLKIEKLYNAYYRYEPIREIFFYIGYIFEWLLKRSAKKITRIETSYNSNIEQYNREIKAYNTIITEVLGTLFNKLKLSGAEFEANYKKLDITSILDDSFGIFTAPEDIEEINDIDNFDLLLEVLSKGRTKLNCAIKTLEGWNDHITNTQNYAVDSILLQSANVVGATCVGISSNPYAANLDFDIVIIDEAGQIQIHNSLIPMRLGKKVIMLGDHKQLPPVAKLEALNILEKLEIEWALYSKSLFEHLYNLLPDSNKTMLNEQFRMPKVIADILSDTFYEGKYESHVSKHNIKSDIAMFDDKPFVVIDTSDSSERHESKENHTNDFEAEICERIFTKLTENNDSKENVAIIAGLNDQIDLIKSKIAEKHGKTVANRVVHTVDSYQGRECDTIIFSFTRSSARLAEDVRVGFLSELRRLNVAMSRCQKCLVLIGDMDFLTQCKNTTGFDGMAEKGIIGTEADFSRFVEKLLDTAKNSDEALYLNSKEFYERSDD